MNILIDIEIYKSLFKSWVKERRRSEDLVRIIDRLRDEIDILRRRDAGRMENRNAMADLFGGLFK